MKINETYKNIDDQNGRKTIKIFKQIAFSGTSPRRAINGKQK